MTKKLTLSLVALLNLSICFAQKDGNTFGLDTSVPKLNMDATYNRPFLSSSKVPVSLGGYIEFNARNSFEKNNNIQPEFQFKRMSLFIASAFSRRFKFLCELEWEYEAEDEKEETEIGIEYAAVDMEVQPLLNLRAGIILNPIGSFNQNHDGPKWEFTDRPTAMTKMLPDVFRNVGFGIYGKRYNGNWMYGYELYLTNGFDSSVVANDASKTYLPASKEHAIRFHHNESGNLLWSGKLTLKNNKLGEFGFSFMQGNYVNKRNNWNGIAQNRSLAVLAFDYNYQIAKTQTSIISEMAWVHVQRNENVLPRYASNQFGGFIDILQVIKTVNFITQKDALIQAALRLEYLDWNVSSTKTSPLNIAEDYYAITPGISFRPNANAVLRLNYKYATTRDYHALATTQNQLILGLATYF